MIQAAVPGSLNGSRLVRLLSGLAGTTVETSPGKFTERLGDLIDLSDSISISLAHGKLPAGGFKPGIVSARVAREDAQRVRSSMENAISRSFSPGGRPTRVKLPAADGPIPQDEKAALEPYLKFYEAHQRDISFRSQNLHAQTRDAVAGLSPDLARLATLDAALAKTLLAPTREFFSAIPKILQGRFGLLFGDYVEALGEQVEDRTLWLQLHEQFCAELRSLLMAEIEARLLPVQGLLESIDEGNDT